LSPIGYTHKEADGVDRGKGFSDGKTAVILLVGGNKRSQSEDIKKAKSYWTQYKTAKGHGS
jgi:putative component of toxin-antitoxin plasmid stabilization module